MINDKLNEIKEHVENIKNIDVDYLDMEEIKTYLLRECESIEKLLRELKSLK